MDSKALEIQRVIKRRKYINHNVHKIDKETRRKQLREVVKGCAHYMLELFLNKR